MPRITVRGPTDPAIAYVLEGPVIQIGRASSNDLVLHDPEASRQHLEIRHQSGGWWVSDRGSRNGTLLDGRPLSSSQPLADGAELHVGDTSLVFEALPDGPGYSDERFGGGTTARLARREAENLGGNFRHLAHATASGVPLRSIPWIGHCGAFRESRRLF